ncbi:Hypothetical predicted protein [Mytilus galloprovincialis]|uniref:Reverse transcriptase domain-containing protein n=1 Tax=Mytilus galloprovincialis TaxID=29158 RepID=A0A8B6BSY1_MYTGA|nr:Hypothetical predicted protein [Mytilus galloprovincialis]
MSVEFAQVENKIKELEIRMSNFELNQQDTNNTQSTVIEKSVQSKLGLNTYINELSGNPIFFICGDFYGRVGGLHDFNDSLDHLPTRLPIDNTRNVFGDFLLDFLKDSKCFMLNGRGDPSKDDFTYVSPIGKSVVDYMIVLYTVLPNFCNFEVKLISSLLFDYGIQLATSSRVPDHSILTCTLNISEYKIIRNERLDRCETSSKGMKYQSTHKYNVSAIPQGLFANERCTNCLEHVVDSILDVRNIGEKINTIYETLIDALHNEMDDNMNYIDFTPSSNNKTSGSMFKTIRFPYSKLKVAVQLSPGILTEWSSIGFCVRQGDNFAPTLFSLFIDSLVLEIYLNSRSYGVPIGNDMVSCLLYADDIVFISESSHGLQIQLDTLHEWTNLNCLQVNIDKTKIMHIRKASAARCDSECMLGNTRIDFANKYRYLGLMISEDMDYAVSVKEL